MFESEASSPVALTFASCFPKHVTCGSQPFTPIDRHFGTNRCVLPWAFLYGETLQPAALQEALAHTLNTFPSLAGRVEPVKSITSGISCFGSNSSTTRGSWQLLLCNKGVPFSVHNSECTLEEFRNRGYMNSREGFPFPDLGNKGILPAYMERLDPSSVLQGAAPVVSVRLTQLSGGGSILAVTAAHVVMDGRSFVQFLKSWSEAYNKLTAPAAVADEGYAVITAKIADIHLQLDMSPGGSSTGDDQPLATGSELPVAVSALMQNTDAAAATAESLGSCGADVPKTASTPVAGAQMSKSSPTSQPPFLPNDSSSTGSSSSPANRVDPLLPGCVPPPGWMSAVKAVRAAHNRLKAEEKHIHRSIKRQPVALAAHGKPMRTNASVPAPAAAGERSTATVSICKDAHTSHAANQKANYNINSVQVQMKQSSQGAAGFKLGNSAAAVPADTNTLDTVLLHIPAKTVRRLKTAGSVLCGGGGEFISSNDAVSALVWMMMCYLRNRPMPGQDRPTHMQGSFLGLALDVRTTAAAAAAAAAATATAGNDGDDLVKEHKAFSGASTIRSSTSSSSTAATSHHYHQQLAVLPETYFGNAAWYLAICSCNAPGRPGKSILPVSWHPRLMPHELDLICSDHKFLIKSLAAGAMSIRSALQAMRADEKFTVKMLQQIEDSLTAPLSSQVSNLAGFVRKLDGFVTSWQFGFWDVRFGRQDPIGFQGFVHPIPPYFSVIVPAPPISATAAGYGTGVSTGNAAEAVTATDGRWLSKRSSVTGSDAISGGKVPCSSSSPDGVLVWLTVPQCLVPVMTSSPVTKLLVPDAQWLSGVQDQLKQDSV